ncbi:MAG TPA: Kae1-associated serine/threonine protein kinase [Candidatus Aenigmarchaeota archaeon]|nr:Kae1-associated serine/threonine protein kinase [Candidatus Aenigmarchaeota archaeon]
MVEVLSRGAEAILLKKDGKVVKRRVRKGYRIRKLDLYLRRFRTKREEKILRKAREVGVPTPKVLSTSKYELVMEFIEGSLLKDVLDGMKKNERKRIMREIGRSIKKLHDANIIHGDLTTSNMILKDKVYFIDFGLGFFSTRIEDKAVDLFLFKKALESKHHEVWEECFKEVLEAYGDQRVMERLKEIEKRGRYRKK